MTETKSTTATRAGANAACAAIAELEEHLKAQQDSGAFWWADPDRIADIARRAAGGDEHATGFAAALLEILAFNLAGGGFPDLRAWRPAACMTAEDAQAWRKRAEQGYVMECH